MSEVVISVENVWKQYRLSVTGSGTLGGDIKRSWAKITGKEDPYLKLTQENDRTRKSDSDLVWALQNINFEVNRGEVVGIIGKNGAGKSTILKILSRVTKPTKGELKVKGRISSLLEVGTGFHPELTGRENVFMNGAILGMLKSEIIKKIDQIIDFSGVERYIDTPVKRYSSGMYVRLAFAVAAHLDPDILVLDEVLAVGDLEFQKKCLGKMQDVSRNEGRTVIFVSHNMAALKSICKTGIVLHNGAISFPKGEIEDAVNHYFEKNYFSEKPLPINQRTDRGGNGRVRVTDFRIENAIEGSALVLGKQIVIKIKYTSDHRILSPKVMVSINNGNGDCVVFMDSSTSNVFSEAIAGSGEISIAISSDFNLTPGTYFLNIAFIVNDEMADYVQNAFHLNVLEGMFFENGKMPSGKSLCVIKQKWEYHEE